jgi:hypothetical protein
MVTPGTPTWAVYSVDVPISIDTGRADDDDEDDEVELDDAVVATAGVPLPSLFTRFTEPISPSMI